ncbi:MAG: FAD-dependent monooxygenase [Bacteroidota bacterium]
MKQQFDVLVVGCGPVGGMAACYLAQQGLTVAVIERNEHGYPYPRAVNLDFFTLTVLQELLGEEINKIDISPWEEAYYFLDKNNLNAPFADAHFSPVSELGAPNNFIYQPKVEEVLRNQVDQHPNITTFFNHGAMKLHREGDMTFVTIQHMADETFSTLSGKFVLGCDGGGSFVRKQIGHNLQSLGDAVLFLVVDAIVPHEKFKGRTGGYKVGGLQIVDKQRPTTFLPMYVNNRCRWEFRLNPDDDIAAIQSPENIYQLLEPFANREDVTLVRNTVYKFNSLIATKWRNGRIFLCGDAAHQTSPFIGQGLNMGIRNTINLCQKIVLFHHGHAREEIFDAYQAECFDPTKGLIKEALFMGRMLFNTSLFANLLRSTISTIRRKKPIDIGPQLTPKVEQYPNSNASKRSSKAYGKIGITTKEGEQFPLLFFDIYSCRIFCRSVESLDQLASLLGSPTIIRPRFYHVVQEFSEQAEGYQEIKSTDPAMVRKLFGGNSYILMGHNNNMIGMYKSGQEAQLIARYKEHFNLISLAN